jgi:hypothetical protein
MDPRVKPAGDTWGLRLWLAQEGMETVHNAFFDRNFREEER